MDILVVGLGKLGLPLALVLDEVGHEVIGLDESEEVINAILKKRPLIEEPEVKELLDESSLNVTQDWDKAVAATSVAMIVVPTPSQEDGAFDSQYVISAVTRIGEALRDTSLNYTVVVVSTVMPGEMDGPIRAALESAAETDLGMSLGLCYSPEFIALGTVVENMKRPDMVLIGQSDLRAGELMQSIYRSVVRNDPPFHHMTLLEAEIAKITVNSFVTMKISFANQLGMVCDELGADVDKILVAVGSDERIGPKYLRAGAAYGGPCFPRDNRAFFRVGELHGVETVLASATDQINDDVIARSARHVRPGDAVAVLGMAYKPGTDVWTESTGVRLVELFTHGPYDADVVAVYDPLAVPYTDLATTTPQRAVDLADIVFIATPHEEFEDLDYSSSRVVDMWGLRHETS